MIKIVQSEDSILRKIAREVSVASITKPKIQRILKDMSTALDSQFDGVAIAAPQIGEQLRIFIISGKIFDNNFIKNNPESDEVSPSEKQKVNHPNLVFINPYFTKISKDKKLLTEGCLSVRPIYGKVRRATKATIEAYNEKGEKFTMNGSGLIAHIFQHESDHLEGVLFTDKAKDTYEVDIETINKKID